MTIQSVPVPAEETEDRTRSTLGHVWLSVRQDTGALFGAAGLSIFLSLALFAPWIAPYDPTYADPYLRLRGPGTEGHLLGLDSQGRDILSRLIHGTRMSLITGVLPVVCGALIAIPLGMIAAYFRGAGQAIMRVMDVFFAFPMVLLAIVLATLVGPGMVNLIVALVIVLVPYNTRVVYVETQRQMHLGYVEAARATATSDLRILFGEMLPHVVSASIVYSMTIVGTIVVTAAGLSFLGLGVQPPIAEWGLMTSEGRALLHIAPHIGTLPGVAIFLLVVSFNLLGDSIGDALDPRRRNQGGQ